MIPKTIHDRFELGAEAASGGMGTVYRGRDLSTGEQIAIKVLRRAGTAEQKRFDREAAILASLSHPTIVPYVAHGILPDGSPYLVMKWIDGELIDTRMQGQGLTIAETLVVARRVAEALAFAHGKGVVHRDIKPSNLIAPGALLEQTMVIDFGVARDATMPGSLTETGAVVGTPSYMAPEQVRGERSLGPAADVFALGCVMYACLTGRVTFSARRFLALRAKIMFWDPPPIREVVPDVPAPLEALVMRMLAKAPASRFPDGAAVLAAIDALPAMAPSEARYPRVYGAKSTPKPPVTGGDPPRRVSIVVVTSPDSLDESEPPSDDDSITDMSLAESLLNYGAAVDVLPDGARVATLTDADSAHQQAVAAVRCALVLRQRFPEWLIGIATAEVRPSEEPDLIDELVGALAQDAMATVFSGVVDTAVPEGAIRLDDRTASLVERDFRIIRARGAAYVSAG
ncbi:MAG TPA: serine/threonine-protein kinase [Kofleriaceae bacterium]|nr:serine/threonine-protein kinase [Kofleriaceae bacterium]